MALVEKQTVREQSVFTSKGKKVTVYKVTITNKKMHNKKRYVNFDTLRDARNWCMNTRHVYHYIPVEG